MCRHSGGQRLVLIIRNRLNVVVMFSPQTHFVNTTNTTATPTTGSVDIPEGSLKCRSFRHHVSALDDSSLDEPVGHAQMRGKNMQCIAFRVDMQILMLVKR